MGGAKVADCFQAGQRHEAGARSRGSDRFLPSLSCSGSCPGVAMVWPIATAAEHRRELVLDKSLDPSLPHKRTMGEVVPQAW